MAKQRLTRRQAWRVEKIQEERLKRAQRKSERLEQAIGDVDLQPERSGLLVAHFGATVEVEAEDGGVFRCALRQNIEALVVGDQVVWQPMSEDAGVVVALIPRRSLLARPDITGQTKPLAANLDQILVVAAPLPDYDTDLIDQYLVAAESTGIHPVIVFNKSDLLDEAARNKLSSELAAYHAVGYQVLFASTKERHGLDELTAVLRDKTSVFVGQSGVGKSSLVQALIPDVEVRVGEVSNNTRFGRHTTSSSRLYHLPSGGNIIDSPGVREFRIWNMDREELAQGFPEFRPFLGACQFRDCRHLNEPGCALKHGVEKGEISAQRLASFQRMTGVLDERGKSPF